MFKKMSLFLVIGLSFSNVSFGMFSGEQQIPENHSVDLQTPAEVYRPFAIESADVIKLILSYLDDQSRRATACTSRRLNNIANLPEVIAAVDYRNTVAGEWVVLEHVVSAVTATGIVLPVENFADLNRPELKTMNIQKDTLVKFDAFGSESFIVNDQEQYRTRIIRVYKLNLADCLAHAASCYKVEFYIPKQGKTFLFDIQAHFSIDKNVMLINTKFGPVVYRRN